VLATGQVAATPIPAVKPVPAEIGAAECSFSTKRRDRVDGLAMASATTGDGVRICAECLALCREIVADTRRQPPALAVRVSRRRACGPWTA
jgi:hypothetical protein